MSSFRPEVVADRDGKFVPNRLRFATEAEAMANVKDLFSRWTSVTAYRVMPSEDPVNATWDLATGSLTFLPESVA